MTFSRSRLSAGLNRTVSTVCVLFILAMLAISFSGFFYMILTGDALSWTYSLARLFIPWLGLLSLTVAFWHGEHIAMTAIIAILPRTAVTVLHYVNTALVALFAGLLIWYGWKYFAKSTDIYMVSDTIQIHAKWVTACVPVTGLVLLIHVLCGANLLDEESPMEEARELAAGEKDNRP
ncbi:TRAP transporter small permease [Acuticoccus sediminis]|uniref:TRAP transporter small permease n=1 Tax=Acuticoccus sediminis TaxID=2184697 RepID=UPI001CFD2868|nr:TRAP transporter small permease subunit [Acuticoccus sediminis]